MSLPLTQSQRVYQALHPNGDPFLYNLNKDKTLEIIGLLLWATEGDKSQLSLANGNPAIIAKYLSFLRTVCNFKEERIKAVIHCHDTIPYKTCLSYWSGVTEIPVQRFNKPYIKQDTGGTKRFPYGIVRVVAINSKLQGIFRERLAELGLPCD